MTKLIGTRSRGTLSFSSGGKTISWLPDIPFYEGTILLILIVGLIYYFATGQGRREDKVEADIATGEAMIA